MTSISVAMDGSCEMALSNALGTTIFDFFFFKKKKKIILLKGSNIFDILIALGLPWFCWNIIGRPVEVNPGVRKKKKSF